MNQKYKHNLSIKKNREGIDFIKSGKKDIAYEYFCEAINQKIIPIYLISCKINGTKEKRVFQYNSACRPKFFLQKRDLLGQFNQI